MKPTELEVEGKQVTCCGCVDPKVGVMLLLAYEVILFIWFVIDIFDNIGVINRDGKIVKIDSRRRLFVRDDELVLSLPNRELAQNDAFEAAANLLKEAPKNTMSQAIGLIVIEIITYIPIFVYAWKLIQFLKLVT